MMSHMTGDAGSRIPTWQNRPVPPKHNRQEGIGGMVSNLPQDRHGTIVLCLWGTVVGGSTAMYNDEQQIISLWLTKGRSSRSSRPRRSQCKDWKLCNPQTHTIRTTNLQHMYCTRLGNGQWRWAVLPLPSDYLMVWLVDEEKSMVAALREVMWYVEKSLARVAFDTSDVAARLGWNGRDERRSGLGDDPWE